MGGFFDKIRKNQAKEQQKAMTREQAEFAARAKAYADRLTELSKETGLTLAPVLQTTPQGIFPTFRIVPVKNEGEEAPAEGEQAPAPEPQA